MSAMVPRLYQSARYAHKPASTATTSGRAKAIHAANDSPGAPGYSVASICTNTRLGPVPMRVLTERQSAHKRKKKYSAAPYSSK